MSFTADSASELYGPSDRRLSTFAVRGVSCGHRGGSLLPYSPVSRPEPLLSLPCSSSVVLARLSGPRSRPTASQENLVVAGIEPGPLDL
jgi:hypothetical protein